MLVASDELTDKDWPALSRAKGDVFMLVGATLYGFSTSIAFTSLFSARLETQNECVTANATEEFFVRRSPLYEVVGQLGMWGTLINGIQAASLEHYDMTQASWNGATSKSTLWWRPVSFCSNDLILSSSAVGLLVAYTAAMFILYTVAPILYRMASSAYYNLSLLSSDFYGLLFGLFLFVSPIALACLDVNETLSSEQS